MTDRRILVTGFGAFPGAPVNPTEALIAALRTARLPGIALEPYVLPVTWAGTGAALTGLIARHAPAAIMMFGLARGSRMLRLETRAVNAATTAHPDAEGVVQAMAVPWPDGPPARHARADLAAVLAAVRASGAPARLSRDAGTYLCNAALWTALAATDERTPVLFIHVPQVRDGGRLTPEGLLAAAVAAIGALRLPG
jgi:pyroglutamyl-peptidase